MRIIPKNTKVKMQFFKGLTLADIIIAVITLGLIALCLSSNLYGKYYMAIGILVVVAPLFIPIGEVKLYVCVVYLFKFLTQTRKYSTQTNNIGNATPYGKLLDNAIQEKTGEYTGVIEIKPIEFNLLSEYKQNHLINVFSNVIKECGIAQEYNLVKVEKPIILDNYITKECERIQDIIQSNENLHITETEMRKRIAVIEDRMEIIDDLNSNETIYSSSYYLVINDIDLKSLNTSLDLICSNLKANNIETKILNKKELAVFIKYTYGKNFDEKEINKLEENEYLKFAIPKQLEFKATNVLQDNAQVSQFVITDYPLYVPNGWGEDLFDIPNTKVVMKMKPVDKYKAIKRIDHSISELSTFGNIGKASKLLYKQTQIETLENLLVQMQNDNESLFDVTMIITAYDEKGKNINKKAVKRKLRELGFKFNEMFGRQHDCYFSSNVDSQDKLNINRGIQSSSIAASFPFISNAVLDENGLLIGENRLPVFLDFFKRTDDRVNSNLVVIGKSGSGKSFATKTILSNLASEDAKIYILDPENEYGTLAKNLNGAVLDVSNSKDGRMNPFHIIEGIDDVDNEGNSTSFFSHLQFLEEFYRIILDGINADSLELLNKITLDVYANKGITNKTDITQLRASDYPIFDDLYNAVEERCSTEKDEYNKGCLKILLNYLAKFKTGGRNSNLWNGFTTFTPEQNFICFNFQGLLSNKNNQLANAQMLLILKWLENEVIKNRDFNNKYQSNRKIVIAIDEAHCFIDEKYPIALDFMYNLAKRIRKYNGMQIVITQNIKDFVGSPEIARKSSAIINVCQYSLIFSLSPNDMSDLCTLYEKAGTINDNETENIINLGRGEAFLISSPANRTNIRIVAMPYIRKLFE